jgi:hypothetical protein
MAPTAAAPVTAATDASIARRDRFNAIFAPSLLEPGLNAEKSLSLEIAAG